MADLEQERVTALWREAAAALDAQEDPLAYAWECAENMKGWALRAEESNRELRAECARLREQLDAADKALTQAYADVIGLSMAGFDSERSRLAVAAAERIERARAALGVVGEPAETSPTIGERESNSRGTGQAVAPPAPSLALQDLISAAGNAARVFTAFVSETDEDLIPMYHEVQEAAEGFQAAAAALGVVGEQE